MLPWVERLQSISEADAIAEGCVKVKGSGRVFENEAETTRIGSVQWYCARDWYADLWNAINGPGAWEANPFVVAYTFRVHLCNIDKHDFCRRFVAEMVRLKGETDSNGKSVRDYAERVAPTYWNDLDYWE